jgi:hypothetical protein
MKKLLKHQVVQRVIPRKQAKGLTANHHYDKHACDTPNIIHKQ